APVADLASRVSPAAGQLTADGPDRALLHAGWDDADDFLGWLFALGVDFEILGPPEFADRCQQLSARRQAGLRRRTVGHRARGRRYGELVPYDRRSRGPPIL